MISHPILPSFFSFFTFFFAVLLSSLTSVEAISQVSTGSRISDLMSAAQTDCDVCQKRGDRDRGMESSKEDKQDAPRRLFLVRFEGGGWGTRSGLWFRRGRLRLVFVVSPPSFSSRWIRVWGVSETSETGGSLLMATGRGETTAGGRDENEEEDILGREEKTKRGRGRSRERKRRRVASRSIKERETAKCRLDGGLFDGSTMGDGLFG